MIPSRVIHDVILVSLAMLARFAAQIALGTVDQPEPWEPYEIAVNLAGGNGFRIENNGTTFLAFSLPLYPAMLATFYVLLGTNALAPLLLNALLGGTLAAVVRHIALRGLSDRAAFFAGALAAIHPGLLVYAGKIHGLNLDALLIALSVLVGLRFVERSTSSRAIALGLTAAMVMLQRPIILPLLIVAGALGLARSPGRLGVLRNLVLAGIVAAVPVAPWLARNEVELGRPVLSSTVWEVIWRGNNPRATGGALTADGRPMLAASPEVASDVWGRPELEQDDLFRRAALEHIRTHPIETLLLTAQKFWQFWWFGPFVGSSYPKIWLTPYAIAYALAAALAAIGAAWLLRTRRGELVVIIVTALLLISIGQSIAYVEGRHRWQIEPLILLLSVAGSQVLARPGVRLLSIVRRSHLLRS